MKHHHLEKSPPGIIHHPVGADVAALNLRRKYGKLLVALDYCSGRLGRLHVIRRKPWQGFPRFSKVFQRFPGMGSSNGIQIYYEVHGQGFPCAGAMNSPVITPAGNYASP
jgi:hypothetical protein